MAKANEVLKDALLNHGTGVPAPDSPDRLDVGGNIQKKKKASSKKLVNMGILVPETFRKRMKGLALQQNITMNELIMNALELYEKQTKNRGYLEE